MQPVPCTGESVVQSPVAGKQRLVLSVRSGPSGPAECETEVVVRLPGHCHVDHDDNNDGIADIRIFRRYDSMGRIIGDDVDNGADGTLEATNQYTYNGFEIATAVFDGPVGGAIERTATFSWNDQGQLVGADIDSGTDGVVNVVHAYSYGASGFILRRDEDDGGALGEFDGVPDTTHTLTYDANNFVTRVDSTGKNAAIEVRTNNELGQVQSSTSDFGSNGAINRRSTYNYDDCW